MKVLVILLVLTLSVTVPASFAQQTADCTFGGMATPMTEKFAKDLAAKAFVEKYPNASRNIPVDEAGNMQNRFILTGDGDVKEILEIQFHTDTNGCYIPASYVYSYDDGMIDLTIINSIGNFTEIMNFIKSDKIMIEDFYPENCNVIHINATMTNGEFYGACKSTNAKSITALASTDSESDLLMDIPLPMLYSIASTDCKITGEFVTIVDNEFVSSEIVPTEKGHMVTVSLDEGFHKVEVLGFTILPDPSPEQYCGIVEGYDKKYLPPLAQINHNMKPTQIRCNEGLVLIQKYDGTPACVTESTKTKLIERGWSLSHNNSIKIENTDLVLNYTMNNGMVKTAQLSDIAYAQFYYETMGVRLKEAHALPTEYSLNLEITPITDQGSITIQIPQIIMDSLENKNDNWLVGVDNDTISQSYVKMKEDNSIKINYPAGTTEIKIIGSALE